MQLGLRKHLLNDIHIMMFKQMKLVIVYTYILIKDVRTDMGGSFST